MEGIIDISRYQPEPLDFDRMRAAGIVAIIHKASQGTKLVDSKFYARRAAILEAGFLFGAYHFGDGTDARTQAAHFLNVTAAERDRTLHVLDFERYDTNQMKLPAAKVFVDAVKTATGRAPVLYTGQSFIHDQLRTGPAGVLEECPLWVARYSQSPPSVPDPWHTWSMWQFSDKGRVDGISGNVDCNRWNGDEAGLRRLWGGA